MKYLLDEDGRHALEAFCMAHTLFAFDFDGTLAPIVENPKNASLGAATAILLEELARLAPVALISGRSRSSLTELLRCRVDFIVGNHGLEGIPGGIESMDAAEHVCKKWLTQLSDVNTADGVMIEDKKYSISLHFRKAKDRKHVRAKLVEIASTLQPPPRIVMGKCVVNLVSPGAPHKGIALLELMLLSGCRSAVYFGDDENDEDVFRLGKESLLTVRIGQNTDSAALFYLNSQGEIDDILTLSLGAMNRAGKRPRKPVSEWMDLQGKHHG